MLNGFKLYYMAPGGHTITFTKNGLGFSKAVVAKMENPRFVKILFDKPGKRMAIQMCEESDDGATTFSRTEKPEGMRWNTRDLTATIRNITGWAVDDGQTYRVEGEWLEDQCAFVFDFTKATIS